MGVSRSVPIFSVFPADKPLFRDLLNDLGYRAVLKWYPRRIRASVFDPSRGVQVGLLRMGHRPPGRVGLPPSLLACGSALNIARFCDRGIGRRMEEATNLQLVDPVAAHDLWSSTEHEIVDLAPRVPLLNRSWAVLVSEVLGDYQFNPQWGPLIDQMWVR